MLIVLKTCGRTNSNIIHTFVAMKPHCNRTNINLINKHMKSKTKILIAMSLLLMAAGTLSAQSLKVTGKVIDSDGYEVIGGNVTIKGKPGMGTITNLNGDYSITVDDAAKNVLVFSYIGMQTLEVPVKGQSTINVTLKADAVMLEEVVAIGYATVKRKDLTGSVTSIKSDELMKTPTGDITQALAGRMAGVQVAQNDGEPGSSISIRVRGGISITQSNEPLYIIDGFPTEDGMASLDPAEIETIDILKDASATAIYGARGANGVVVITTKSGGEDDTKATVSFDTYVGVRKLARKLDVLSPAEFVLADYERTIGYGSENEVRSWQNRYGSFLEIDENYGGRPGIDWQEETLGRTTLTQSYRVGVSGGSKKTKYAASYSYYDDEGAMVYSGNNKHTLSLNLNADVKDWLKFTARLSFDQRKVWGAGTAGKGEGADVNARFNKMAQILQQRPTIGLIGEDTDLLTGRDPLHDLEGNVMVNPLINAREEEVNKEYRTFQANGGITVKLTKELNFRNTTGMNYRVNRNSTFYGENSMMGRRSGIYGFIQNTEGGSFQTSNVLTYTPEINKSHHLTAMLGQEYVTRWSRWVKSTSGNFPNDDIGLGDMSLGTPDAIASNENYDDNLVSFFARANYDFRDRYLFTASLRADGSSKFGKNNKWGYFPAVSAAWRMAEEEFIKKLNIFSDLKLRIGYGLAGNNRIGSYNSLAILSATLTAVGDTHMPGYVSKQIPNPDLKWEANKTFNLGLDLGFLNQRITISPEFYINKSSNLLLSAKLPQSSGYSTMIINAGATKNMGVDLTVNTVNITNKDFEWKTSLTFSHNKNTVEELTGEAVQLYEARFGYNQSTHRIAVGEPVGQFYGYRTLGLYQVDEFDYDPDTQTYLLKEGIPYHGDREKVRPGMWKFANLDDSNNIIDENDKTVIGNANPVFYGGLNNNFSYRNFDLSVFLTFSYGAEVMNATKFICYTTGASNKQSLDCSNSSHRWMTINSEGMVVTDPDELKSLNRGKTIAAYYNDGDGGGYIHSWGVEDASFLKLSNVTLGYTFPRKMIRRWGLSKLRVYFTGSNLLTWTPYTGYDPEVSTMRSGLTPGVDYGSYPRSRSFIFGMNVAF